MLTISTPDEYTTMISRSEPTLLKFHASWCAPCKILSAVLMTNQVPHVTVDIDSEALHDTIQDLNIRSVPTLILFKSGVEVGRLTGLQSVGTINQLLSMHQTI